MEDQKFTVEDAADIAGSYSADKGYYAYNSDSSVVIMFLEYGSKSDAVKAYADLKTDLDTIKDDSSKTLEKEAANYSKYSVETTDAYGVVSRTDSTIVCASAASDHKSEVTDVLKALGY